MTGIKSRPDTLNLTLLTLSRYIEILCSLGLGLEDRAGSVLLCQLFGCPKTNFRSLTVVQPHTIDVDNRILS